MFAAHKELKSIGNHLEDLGKLRNQADYEIWHSISFLDDAEVTVGLHAATASLSLLDAIDADPARRAGAIAAIRTIP